MLGVTFAVVVVRQFHFSRSNSSPPKETASKKGLYIAYILPPQGTPLLYKSEVYRNIEAQNRRNLRII